MAEILGVQKENSQRMEQASDLGDLNGGMNARQI